MNTIKYPKSLLANCLQSQQSLLMVINFIDSSDLSNMYHAILSGNLKVSNTTKNIILSFIFNKNYLTKVDRTMSYFIYQNPLTQHIDSLSALNIALNSPSQPQNITLVFNQLFNNLQYNCMMNVNQVEAIKMIVTEPDLPLPVALRSNIGQHCSSNFQLFICSKIVQPLYSLSEQSQFSDFKNFLSSNQEKYIRSFMKNTTSQNSVLNNIRQLYENPQIFMENLSETEEVLTDDNHIYNFFITLMKLTKTVIRSIKLRLNSVGQDPYTYFTEFLLRYSLYKNYLLQLEDNLGSVFDSFKSILEDSLNMNFGKGSNQTQFSLWKILIRNFAKSMNSQIEKCLPIFMNLTHKTKLKLNNKIYAKTNLFHKDNLIPEMQQFDGSPVLEYLLDQQNTDNAQVFLSDFMEMLVDLSVDESNVLLCGSSKQQPTNKHFEKLEQLFIENECKLMKIMIEKSQNDEIQQQAQEEFAFLEKNLNIKPRTLKLLLNELDNELVSLDFETVDEKLAQLNRKYFGQVRDMHSSKESAGSSLTADSDESGSDFDFEGLEYFSEVDDEEMMQDIDF